MAAFSLFEGIVRRAAFFTEASVSDIGDAHPFILRDIHASFPSKVRKLFDDAHYAEATFDAAKFIDKRVSKLTGLSKTGAALMQEAFSEKSPLIKLSALQSETALNEQKGYMSLFVGLVWAIRNPRGHEYDLRDEQSLCLDHLSFMSMLIRRLETAGYVFT